MATRHPYARAAKTIDAALTKYHGQPAGLNGTYAAPLRDGGGAPILRIWPDRHGAQGAAETTVEDAENVRRVTDYYARGGKPRISVIAHLDLLAAQDA